MSKRMKAIRNRNDLESVSENDEYLYLGFRPSSKDLIIMIQKAPALKIIYMPKSYFKTLSKSMIMMLEMKNVQLKDEGVQNNKSVTSCYILNDDTLEEEPETQNQPEDHTQDTAEEPETQDQPEEEDKEKVNDQFGNMASTGGEDTVPTDE